MVTPLSVPGLAQQQPARARGVEPREAVLEAAGSPRSTLVDAIRFTGPPGYLKGVEPSPPRSQPGMQRPLHHRHHFLVARPGFEPGTLRSKRSMISVSLSSQSIFSGLAGESNPDLLGASEASSRWTSRPKPRTRSHFTVPGPGVAPGGRSV